MTSTNYFVQQEQKIHFPDMEHSIKTDYILGHKIHINKFKEQKSYNVCF